MTHFTSKSIKVLAAAGLAIALTAGTAYAGPNKDCDDSHKTKVNTQASMQSNASTTVLSASQSADKMAKVKVKAAKNEARKIYSFDEALEKCQKKGAADLQACIDYKTGKTLPKS